MQKSQRKAEDRVKKQIQAQRKQRQTRIWVWSTVVAFVALIVLVVVFKPEAKPASFEYEKLPTLGQSNAPVKIVEFGDYKCITCKMFSQEIEPQLQKDFIDTGKASLSFMNFMIIAPDSYTAALAGQAVFHQSNEEYWKFYDAVYKNQGDEGVPWATSDYFVKLAKDLGLKLDYDKLKQDIDNETYKDEVNAQDKLARNKLKLGGTPSIFINGKKLTDNQALQYANLKKEIEKALEENKG
ncbi:DsbA family protein [Cohnella nanjingensis]|uniref:Thioredoxin domain-containing protein n=1 Tax=Cohnella nanjingensis TaxID=1387779 RepID=A0A7X0RX66_9BACL|nr:thioredoxin domain-containing protein [Cohnella nanjingensis]MBB6675283.1 thioredoxin domain-containing protein [Cohnella nanjingensis]